MSVISKGLEGVVATDTRLGDVRGQEGQLIYCGYDINELAGKASFEEVIYLLWHNKLPNRLEVGVARSLVDLGPKLGSDQTPRHQHHGKSRSHYCVFSPSTERT